MPTHLLLRCAWQFHDSSPKNQAVINPCFRVQWVPSDPTAGTDAQQLCDDLAAAVHSWSTIKCQLTVKAYNLQGAKPNYPLASKTLAPAVYTRGSGPPELALCLSYYGPQNIPRKRGRLYVPAWQLGTAAAEFSSHEASATFTAKVAALVPIFAGLGGVNVDWIVWSRVNQSATRVENYWVDNAWDIQRSRGLPGSLRNPGTTGG